MKPNDSLRQLADKYHLSEIYAFGSRAKEIHSVVEGRFPESRHSTSDVDISVMTVPGHPLSPKARVELTIALEDLFRVNKVDLVVLPEADPFLALDIIRGELLYCCNEDIQAEHELEILRRAADLLPFKEERIRMVLQEGAR